MAASFTIFFWQSNYSYFFQNMVVLWPNSNLRLKPNNNPARIMTWSRTTFFPIFFVGKTSGLTRIVFLTNWGYEAFLLQVKFCFLVHTSLYNTTMFCILCKTQSSWINAFSCVFFGKRTEIFLIKTDMRNDLVTSSMRVSVFLETHHSSIFLKMNTICLAIIFLTHK